MPALLVLAFLVVPLLEIYVIVQVGQVIGAWWTVLLLLAESLFGAWIVRREGRRAWHGLRDATSGGRMPSRELADGALLLIGGTLLLTPGFLTDAAGFLLVIPPTRALARRILLRWIAARAVVVGGPMGYGVGWAADRAARDEPPRPGRRPPAAGRRPGERNVVEGEVVEGEVVDGPDEPPRAR